MLNLEIGELKPFLESCGLVTIKDNDIKFVIDISSHVGNYSWSMFCLENSVLVNYYAKISITRFSKNEI